MNPLSSLILVMVLVLGTAVFPARGDSQAKVKKLPVAERREFESLATMSPVVLDTLARETRPELLAATMREILDGGGLYPGTRPHDEEGLAPVHRYLLKRFDAWEERGLVYLGGLKGEVIVPVPVDRLVETPAEEASTIEINGRSWRVEAFWPNGALPNVTPREGLRGRLIDVGSGEWHELEGRELKGAIALMSFSGGRNFDRLFSLGCEAVVVVEDENVIREKAERLFCNTPVPMPRFYVNRTDGAALRALEGNEAVLRGGVVFESRPFFSPFVHLPPTEKRAEYTVQPWDLLQRIAADFGLSLREVQAANPELTADPAPGTKVRIPGSGREYTVKAGDLLDRLASHYGVDAAAIRTLNKLESPELAAGRTLLIPHLPGSLVLLLPLDSVSSIPGAPHGAKVAANLAVALAALEHLSGPDTPVRRRGLVVGFLDAEHLGGLSSRLFAEYVLRNRGKLQSRFTQKPEDVIRRYEEALGWLGDKNRTLPADTARWFAQDWLKLRLEKQRTMLAEERIQFINRQREATDPDRAAAMQKEVDSRGARLQEASRLRLETLENKSLDDMTRLRMFFDLLADSSRAEVFHQMGVREEALRERLALELREESQARIHLNNNLRVVSSLLGAVSSGDLPSGSLVLGWGLELSDGSPTLRIDGGPSTDFRVDAMVPHTHIRRLETRLGKLTAFASVRGGWGDAWPLVGEADRVDFQTLPFKVTPAYPEFWAAGDIALACLRTVNDRLDRLDTPRDTLAQFRIDNLAAQARHALLIVRAGLETPVDGLAPTLIRNPSFGRLIGQTVEFNIRSGIDAKEPVAGSYVYYPAVKKESSNRNHNTSTYQGGRVGIIRRSLTSGSFTLPVELIAYNKATTSKSAVYAYRFDRRTGLFDRVVNQGQVGTGKQNPGFSLLEGADVEKTLVMTAVYPFVFFPGVDPMDYNPVGSERSGQAVRVIDSVLNGEPRDYALDNASRSYGESDVDSNILYLQPGRRARILVQRGTTFNMMLIGQLTPENDKGEGYTVGPLDMGSRNLTLPMTPLRVASDMHALARRRQELYRQFGIFDQSVDLSVQRSGEKLLEARAAAEKRQWQMANGAARESWGMLVKTYPRILTLGREAVFSVILLMALLVPAAMFLEKLAIGSKGIVARLIWASALFVAGALFLNQFHPAFQISVSPFIVMISFVMILMSAFVLALSYERFDVLLRRARSKGGEVEDENISLMSSLSTALSLGVSNLKKRPSRTVLTALTVSVLTFSIIAFVSVKGSDTLFQRAIQIDHDVEGEKVAPLVPAYEGILFRDFFWVDLDSNFVSAVKSEFGARYPVTSRAHYIETEGGNTADREGVNQLKLAMGGKSHVVSGVMAFEHNEPEFSRLNEAVSRGTWFSRPSASFQPEEAFRVIIPDTAAADLGITEEMIFEADGRLKPWKNLPEITMLNLSWRVCGILDTAKADTIRDINGKSLAMVDYMRSAFSRNAGGGHLENEPPSYHVSWKRLVIVPMEAADYVRAKPRSVAIKVRGGEARELFQDLALRLNKAMFSHQDGTISLLTTKTSKNIGGLAKVLVPVLLCILIVSNTMMGTVEERKGEVSMLGAIGLSPSQISFLLLSESTVFSVLGIVFGSFAGLLFANLIPMISANFDGFMGGLTFNFTSLSSMALALGTGGIVLLATLVPALKAAALAAPSGMAKWTLPPPNADGHIEFNLPFTLTRGNAVGMTAFFRQFLVNHMEPTSSDFNCRHIRVTCADSGRPELGIHADMWLSPYDLDVAQHFHLLVRPTENEGVYAVTILIERTSGTEEAWLRTNYGLLDLVRLQFLLWRNLDPKRREEYITQGAELVKGATHNHV